MYLVTGATGLIGRPLVRALLAEGVRVRAVTRDVSNADIPSGVEPVHPNDVAAALSGVDGVFVHPRATLGSIHGLLDAAVEEGVPKVVVMSAINVDDEPDHQPSRFNGDRNTEAELAVVSCGLPWVAVRPGSFAANTLGMWRGQMAFGDTIRSPYGAFAEAVIHERDVAEVIASALLDDALLGRTLAVTGPEALTPEEMVAVLSAAIDRPLAFEEMPPEMAAEGMIRSGLDEGFVGALLSRYERETGRQPAVTTEVEAVLGRPARAFADWAADHVRDWS